MITPAVGTRQSFTAPFCPISSIGTGHIICRSRTSKYCAKKKRTTFMAHLPIEIYAICQNVSFDDFRKYCSFPRDFANRKGYLKTNPIFPLFSFATRLAQTGVDPYTIQKLIGHTSFTTTQRYAHHFVESLRREIEYLEVSRKKREGKISTMSTLDDRKRAGGSKKIDVTR